MAPHDQHIRVKLVRHIEDLDHRISFVHMNVFYSPRTPLGVLFVYPGVQFIDPLPDGRDRFFLLLVFKLCKTIFAHERHDGYSHGRIKTGQDM